MSLERVKHQLQRQYQIDNFIDLVEFDNLPTGKLYTALRKLHKDVFKDNERVVFVADNSLKKTFTDQPRDIITVLQQYIQAHDIPHFFVIVVSNIDTIGAELIYVHQLYNKQEETPITHIYYE